MSAPSVDMIIRPSVQLTSVSGYDSKLGHRTRVRPSFQSTPVARDPSPPFRTTNMWECLKIFDVLWH